MNQLILPHIIRLRSSVNNEIVEFAELQGFLDMPIKNYSSGMAACLGFSIATVVRPEVLIVDDINLIIALIILILLIFR